MRMNWYKYMKYFENKYCVYKSLFYSELLIFHRLDWVTKGEL